jgi:hypothetical protein
LFRWLVLGRGATLQDPTHAARRQAHILAEQKRRNNIRVRLVCILLFALSKLSHKQYVRGTENFCSK